MGKFQDFWFRHDCNASADPKMVRLLMKKGGSGYGLYWLILELLSVADDFMLDCAYDEIAYRLHEEESEVKSVIEDFDLFQLADGKFYSARLRENMIEAKNIHQKAVEAGKRGGEKRWANSNPNSNPNGGQIADKDKDKEKNPPYSPPTGEGEGGDSSRFVRPTVDEVRAYCEERGNGIDPEEFVAFYESKGWMVGKDPMKSWKGAVVTWEKKRKKEQPAKAGTDWSKYLG